MMNKTKATTRTTAIIPTQTPALNISPITSQLVKETIKTKKSIDCKNKLLIINAIF